jgi:hypothetical protein
MRETRLYGLFEKEKLPNGKFQFTRVCGRAAFRKTEAVRCFQSLLLGGALQGRVMELRPVKD